MLFLRLNLYTPRHPVITLGYLRTNLSLNECSRLGDSTEGLRKLFWITATPEVFAAPAALNLD